MSANGKKKRSGMSTKRDLYMEHAQHLFVVEQKTIIEIAQELDNKVSEQTIRNWSAEYGWVEKRKKTITAKEAFDIEIYNTARAISKSIREDLEQKIPIAPSRYYTLARMIEVIPKAKKSEQEMRRPGADVPPEFSSFENLLTAIHKSLIGGH